MSIKTSQIKQLVNSGYTLIPGFLDRREVKAAMKNVQRYAPTASEVLKNPERYSHLLDDTETGKFEFPFVNNALNHISTHPRLISMVRKILGTQDVQMARSCVWAKYGCGTDYDQTMHMDFQGSTLVVPREDGDYRQINLIFYYSDVSLDLGPTFVVPNEKAREMHAGQWPPHRLRKDWPELYAAEQPLIAKAGDLLVFAMSTFHRGSVITNPKGARFTHHLVYHASRHRFVGHYCWASRGEEPELADFIESATPTQREVIGFPAPGDAYWNRHTLEGVALRYPGMDMTPYLKHAKR